MSRTVDRFSALPKKRTKRDCKKRSLEVYEHLRGVDAEPKEIRSGWKSWIVSNWQPDIIKALVAADTFNKAETEYAGKLIGLYVLSKHSEAIIKELNKRQIPYGQRPVALRDIAVETYHKWRKERRYE